MAMRWSPKLPTFAPVRGEPPWTVMPSSSSRQPCAYVTASARKSDRDRTAVGSGYARRQPDGPPDPGEGAVGRYLVCKATGEEIFGQCLPAPRRHIPEVAPVDREAGGVAAKCQAFRIFKSERPVWRRASGANPEALFDVVEELVGAGEHARDVRADSDDVAAHRLEEEHVVEARGASYLGGFELEQFGDMGEPVGAQVAVLLLQHVQDRDESGALDRVQSDQFSRSHEVVVV